VQVWDRHNNVAGVLITPLVSSNSSYTYADDSTASYCNYDINKVVNTLETLHCCLVLVTSRCFLFVSNIRRVAIPDYVNVRLLMGIKNPDVAYKLVSLRGKVYMYLFILNRVQTWFMLEK
jgi:hypothetical protein